jgi:hypothetical protein
LSSNSWVPFNVRTAAAYSYRPKGHSISGKARNEGLDDLGPRKERSWFRFNGGTDRLQKPRACPLGTGPLSRNWHVGRAEPRGNEAKPRMNRGGTASRQVPLFRGRSCFTGLSFPFWSVMGVTRLGYVHDVKGGLGLHSFPCGPGRNGDGHRYPVSRKPCRQIAAQCRIVERRPAIGRPASTEKTDMTFLPDGASRQSAVRGGIVRKPRGLVPMITNPVGKKPNCSKPMTCRRW